MSPLERNLSGAIQSDNSNSETEEQKYRERVKAAHVEYDVARQNAIGAGMKNEKLARVESILAKYLDGKYALRWEDSIDNAVQCGKHHFVLSEDWKN